MRHPDFYHPERVGTVYRPNISAVMETARSADVPPADEDRQRLLLLLIDAQVDFIHTDGSLNVPGAVDDTRRTIGWIYDNLPKITRIAASFDTHEPMQIFYPGWWMDADGRHPDPFTLITAEDVDRGRWQPTVEEAWSRDYVHRLEESSRKVLTIWPYHTMLGTVGHAMTPALYEAVTYHAAARGASPVFLIKGRIPMTEHYSVLEPEVKVPEHPQGTLNEGFVNLIGAYDRVYIAGQAKSHCVLETTISLIEYYRARRPDLIANWHVLMDCTSSVVHPDVDFDAIAEETYRRHNEEYGLRLVTGEEPVE